MERGFLMVRRSDVAISPHEIFVHPPKTKKSARRVDLDAGTINILRKHRQEAKTKWVCEDPKRPGGMPNPWNITTTLHNSCINAGIPCHTFHSLRHTHATLLLSEGVHPKIVSERLGHSKISITLDTYSHVIPTMQQAAIDAITHLHT